MMTVTLQFDPVTAATLQEYAAAQGLAVSRFVLLTLLSAVGVAPDALLRGSSATQQQEHHDEQGTPG